ncbi:MAG: FtsX-like permease family protein [Spirochaetaceae bacterium]
MFKNYIIIALRSISKQKTSSLIAILGLALGIASSLILYVYIDYQLSYDGFLPENSGIKRVLSRKVDIYQEVTYSGGRSVNNYTAKLFKEKIDFVKDVATYSGINYLTLLINGELYNEEVISLSDNFFNVIPFEVISGNRESMQSEQNYIVLDKEFAEKYYPKGDALGQNITIKMGQVYNLTITGVVDIPKNSHFKHEFITAFISENIIADLVYKELGENMFRADEPNRDIVYISVEQDYDSDTLIHELNNIIKEVPTDDRYLSEEIFLEDFEDIHLKSKALADDATNPRYILILLIILAFTLLVSSVINSVSILTASSINRTKEVGVRVVMGSSKKDLVFQFLTESVILTFISLLLALVIAELFLPAFSRLVFIDLTLDFSPIFIVYICLLTLIIGVITGLYPAFYLSNLKVVESLKGKSLLKLGKSKKVLVISQFFISSVILICCLVMNNELNLLGKLDVGFNSTNLIYAFPGLNFDVEPIDKIQNLKNEIKDIPGIVDVTYTTFFPYSGGPTEENIYKDDNEVLFQELSINVDSDYFNTIGIIPKEGVIKIGTVVVMESVKSYRDINVGDIIGFGENSYTVGAIIKDYFLNHALVGESPKFHIISEDNFYFQIIKFSGEPNLKEIKKVWNKNYPDKVTDLHVMSIEEENNLDIVVTLKKVMNLTMIITVFISGLGLIGLILHSVKQKNKEIGIRKVLGADVISVVKQFVGDLVKYVIIGVGFGIPFGAYLISFGLKEMGYPFKIHSLYQISILSGLVIILVGIILTFIMVFKSATSNPSNALRYE